MWKKDEETKTTPGSSGAGPVDRGSAPSRGGARTASIGSSITIHGEVSGDEDLLIQGRVEGSIDLKEHAVTIGGDGKVSASIHARIVTVEGRVEGDIEAQEQVVLRSSSEVEGDITAPRVVLEDGARFRGGVDMGDPARSGASSTAAARSASKSSSSTSGSGAGTSDDGSSSSSKKSSSTSSSSKSSSTKTASAASSSA